MTAIKVTNANKIYTYTDRRTSFGGKILDLFAPQKSEKAAVSNFSFEVAKGEFIGLIGPNGAGKTTLMKMLTGIIQPTSGEIAVLGYNPAHLTDEYKRKYSLVMGQKSQLWWDLTALDTFILNREIYQIPEEEFQQKVAYFTRLFEVEEMLNVQVRQLSLGERMKMELISCLLHNPSILFLDEPTIGLDAIAQKQIRAFLQQVNHELGTTIILTSHYMEDIKRLCKRVIVINKGKKVYDGELKALLAAVNEYKTITVAFAESTDMAFTTKVEWLEKGPYRIVFKVSKDRVGSVMQELFASSEVSDISIEEEEIENLIEKIYRKGQD